MNQKKSFFLDYAKYRIKYPMAVITYITGALLDKGYQVKQLFKFDRPIIEKLEITSIAYSKKVVVVFYQTGAVLLSRPDGAIAGIMADELLRYYKDRHKAGIIK